MSAFRSLDKVLDLAVIGCFILMILTVCLQVFARYALPWSPPWTEELARFAFIYMVSLGTGLAIKDRSYVNVDILLQSLGERKRVILDSFILMLIILLMGLMLWYSIPLIRIVQLQQSASLKINMALIYLSMFFMALLVILYAYLELIKNVNHIRNSR
ncbi:TRAP transporter small permease [Cecembia lonarensis]|uniref:TRAP-type C4-dicarboxylate transport system, small permease component n=1 Tax=Cecembia lonarensis (strain CCUG 58316 / KCTC 22772 / LW9) TaxID=1225176 RepID=K1LYA5_CECL9|nr:TRAP transporter small permease [Cecembia lonarensis]EKB49109.1 TRAP-type C4-dicarboxylate transport system, small permease component [Cecembia lonarensis LW9]